MNKALYIFLVILALAVSIVFSIFESASYVYYDAQNVYRVYLNGESLGIIEDKNELEGYINEEQQSLKQEYNVDNVYSPNGLEIKEETTYNEKTESVDNIYNKISEEEDFTIDGYTVTITDKKEVTNEAEEKIETQKIKEYIYILDKNILREAVNDVVKSFVDEEEYQNYLNETVEDPTEEGTIIESVYLKEQISIKKGKIPANETIYQTEQELAKYLLFGTQEDEKTYTVKSGDTIAEIANDNKLSTEELLIANQDISDENALLYPGQKLVVSLIDPVITVVEETHTVSEEDVKYKTIQEEDDTMYVGYSEVIQEGKNGRSLITRKIQKENGQIKNAIIVSSEVLKEPVNKIVKTGKKTSYAAGSTTDWGWPTVANYTLTDGFAWRWGKMHVAQDIAGLGCGTPIYAINDGTVITAEYHWSFGNYVEINHNNGYISLYAHMSTLNVSVGQAVSMGQQIGTMGETGESYGCHLHLQVEYNGTYFDPMTLY